MKLLDKLKRAATSDIAIHTRFLQQYNPSGKEIHVFHEGQDDPSFYGGFIESRTHHKRRVHYYNCKNKTKVHEQYAKIDWNKYQKRRSLFFVDKDLEDILGLVFQTDTNIFVTRPYSIENYLVSESVFVRCLRELVNLQDYEIKVLRTPFRSALKRFHQVSQGLSAYIVLHRKRGTVINLGNISIAKILDLSDPFEAKNRVGMIRLLDNALKINTGACFPELRKIVKQLRQIQDPKIYIRGKYELEFLVILVKETVDMLNHAAVGKKYKISLGLSKSNAVQLIASRLSIPKELSTFLKQNL